MDAAARASATRIREKARLDRPEIRSRIHFARRMPTEPETGFGQDRRGAQRR
jgi:hypothetical protein